MATSDFTHFFKVDVAVKVGVNAAIVYECMRFLVRYNQNTEQNFHDGRYWVYGTYENLSKFFPYMSVKQVKYAIAKLIDSGLIIKSNFSFGNLNRTNWYSISEAQETTTENGDVNFGQTDWTNLSEPIGQNCPNYKKDIIVNNNSNANDFICDNNACACAREDEEMLPWESGQSDTQQLVKSETGENREELGARAREKFRSEVYASTIKRDQIMKANEIYDTTEYYTIAESILSEWDASEMPPNEVTWRHFTNVFRIRVQTKKRNATNQPKSREQQLAELQQGAERIVARAIAESEANMRKV